MRHIQEFFYGGFFSNNLSTFIVKLAKINEDYTGDFDVKKPYCTTITRGSQVTLIFDPDKEIPKRLKEEVLIAFETIINNKGQKNNYN